MDLELVEPVRKKKLEIWAYREEFLLNGESIPGTSGLENAQSFEEWILKLKNNSCDETLLTSLVPSTTYLVIRKSDEKIVGMLDIRHRLNNSLLKQGGHIGYSIRKSERHKGCGKELLRLALIECKKYQLKEVLLTCSKKNIASSKTILANNGVLENEILNGDRITQRYWIKIY